MLELDNALVKRGLWTDYSKGSIMGKVITTDIRTGTVVVSILAIFASLATTHLWHFLTFVTHQSRARGHRSDGLFWQQQAILRTLPTPSTFVAGNFTLWWSWRHTNKQALMRCLLPVLLPLLFISGTLVATISTNYVVDTSDIQVLIDSPSCGTADFEQTEFTEYQSQLLEVALDYRDECYRNTSSLPATCRNILPIPRLPLTHSTSECPFAESMCITDSRNRKAVSMDTGLLDTATIMGINVPPSDSIKFRHKTTCAVMSLEDRYTLIRSPGMNDPETDWETSYFVGEEGMLLLALSYGPSVRGVEYEEDIGNVTFTVPLPKARGVTLNAAVYKANDSDRSWDPIPELKRSDADTSLLVVRTNGTYFSDVVDDPMFSAHVKVVLDSFSNLTGALTDNPVGVMACADQYQYCISRSSGQDFCTELGGLPQNMTIDQFPGASSVQLAQLKFLHLLETGLSMSTAVTSGIEMSTTVMPVAPVAPNQWEVQALAWKSYILSAIQNGFPSYAIGPKAWVPDVDVQKPGTEGEKQLCRSQRLKKAGGFANINYFGLIFIIVVSSTIVILDLTIVKILICVKSWTRSPSPRLDRWVQDGILQLQRRAFEAEGKGTWIGLDAEVPITTKNVKFDELAKESVSPIQQVKFEFPKLGYNDEAKSMSTQTTIDFDAIEVDLAQGGVIKQTPTSSLREQSSRDFGPRGSPRQ